MTALAAICALAATACIAVTSVAGAATPPTAPYVVVLADGLSDPAGTATRLADEVGFKLKLRYFDALAGFSTDLIPAQVAALQAAPEVAFVEADRVLAATGKPRPTPTPTPTPTPAPDPGTTLPGPVLAGDTVPPGVRRVHGVVGDETQGAGAPVAVLDSGIDFANGDLDGRNGVNCITSLATAQDDTGHGTNVAGIIGARNNGAGVIGVAPGTPLYAVKVLGKTGTGTLSQLLCGINWVTANSGELGIRVANMSISGTGSDDGNCGNTSGDSWHKALCASTAAGVTWVVSAGNNARDLATTIPAAYPEVLTVTAVSDTDGQPGALGAAPACRKGEADDRYGAYSNWAVAEAAAAHTIAAPGTCVVSTKLGGGTSTYYGTSQAAPHVAAATALCIGPPERAGPCAGLAPADVIRRVRDDAAGLMTLANGFLGDPLRALSGRTYGPLVNAAGY